MNNFNKTICTVWAAVLALAVSLTSPTTTRAADINWGAATPINPTGGATSDLDVSTQGALVGAINFGDNNTFGEGVVQGATVNGVNFQALPVSFLQTDPASLTSGGVTFSLAPVSSPSGDGFLTAPNGPTGFGSTTTPFSNLSNGYQTILGSGVLINSPDTMVLTMSGLSVGQTYQFEWWANFSTDSTDPGPTGEGHIAAGDSIGDSVSLNDNTTNAAGGLGQYTIGTFTADSTSEIITFEAPAGDDQSAQINALQLRTVPDSMNTLIGLGFAISGLMAFYGFTRRQRTQQI